MTYRPAPEEFDRLLTEEQVRELQRQLLLLSAHNVAEEYRRAYEACRMNGDVLTRASAIQNLVAAWRVSRGGEGMAGGPADTESKVARLDAAATRSPAQYHSPEESASVSNVVQFGRRSGSSNSAVTGFFNGHGIQVQQHQ